MLILTGYGLVTLPKMCTYRCERASNMTEMLILTLKMVISLEVSSIVSAPYVTPSPTIKAQKLM